jgi:quercetin dioxygenase-like cupin family protein
MTLEIPELHRFVARLASTPELWHRSVCHSRDARSYAQIWDEPEVNAWVICWSAGHDTGFHDHDTSAAAITVVEGQIRDERLRLARTPQSRVYGPGETLWIPANAIHRVRHAGASPSVTIHAYSPPLRRTGAYEVGPGGVLERTAQPVEQELRATAALA